MNPQLDLDGSPRIYRFEATVTGPDEQPVTTTTEVKALPSFVLGLKIPRYLEKATELKPEVVAVGVDDKPMKGQEVRVRSLIGHEHEGTLRLVNPSYSHSFGSTVPELLAIGRDL